MCSHANRKCISTPASLPHFPSKKKLKAIHYRSVSFICAYVQRKRGEPLKMQRKENTHINSIPIQYNLQDYCINPSNLHISFFVLLHSECKSPILRLTFTYGLLPLYSNALLSFVYLLHKKNICKSFEFEYIVYGTEIKIFFLHSMEIAILIANP